MAMRGQDTMFRALVVASALLTATLAAVLFMPGIGREGAGAEGATTGDMLRSGGLLATAEAPARPLARPEGLALRIGVEERAEADLAGPLADADRLAAAVALSAPAREEGGAAPDPAPQMAGAGDVAALSRGVLAGLGHEMPEAPAAPEEADPELVVASAEPLVRVERSPRSLASSERAMKEAAAWTTDYVLIGLGQGPRRVTSALEDAQEWSTAYVLNGLGAAGAAAKEAGAATGQPGRAVTLEEVIAGAIEEGRSDEYLVALIDQLSAAGKLDAPAALMRPDGQVDSALVLNALVEASTARAARQASAGEGSPRPAPVQRPVARRLAEPVSYTVQPGDSLAAIAYRFYGVTSRYTMIFEANRERLPSPDEIRAGQRLTIPAG